MPLPGGRGSHRLHHIHITCQISIPLKHLIRHLVSNHLSTIVSQSLLHCHVRGLHSIMLLQCRERTIRLYVTSSDHEMWHNYPASYGQAPLSIGFHAHHCNLTLDVVRGSIFNWTVKPSRKGFLSDRYIWQSPIEMERPGGFILDAQGEVMDTVGQTVLDVGEWTMMQASEIHTVAVQQGAIAAWLVYEGLEDTGYVPYTWSNAPLEEFSTDSLYIKPTQQEVIDLLISAELI